MKFAVLSSVLPPTDSGQAIMLYRLLKNFDPDEYCLISPIDYSPGAMQRSYTARLPARYYHVPPINWVRRGQRYRVGEWMQLLIGLRAGIWQRARQVGRILRQERCGAIVACSAGDLLDFPAAAIAAQRTGAKFIPYVFDYYREQWSGNNPWNHNVGKRVGPLLEKQAMDHADAVIVPNEFMADSLRGKYLIDPTVIHNPVDFSEHAEHAAPSERVRSDEIRIVFTGAVYEANLDAFLHLLTALTRLGRINLRLHIYTAQSHLELEKAGISGPVVFHGHVPASAVPAIQENADLLFLPLGLSTPYPEIIRTSAPGKFGEYLASGTTILARVPGDSFVAWYLRHYECGMVCDGADPADTAAKIARVLDDVALRDKLTANGMARAHQDFDMAAASSVLRSLLSRLAPATNAEFLGSACGA